MIINFSNIFKEENVYAEPFIRFRFKDCDEINAIVINENGSLKTPDYYLKPTNVLLEIKRILQAQIIREIMISETIKKNLNEEIIRNKYVNGAGYFVHIYPYKCPNGSSWKSLLSKHKKEFVSDLLNAIKKGDRQIDYKKAYIMAEIKEASYVKPNNILFLLAESGFFDLEGFVKKDVIRLLENAAKQLSNNVYNAEKRILLLHYPSKNDQFNEWLRAELESRVINDSVRNIDEVWVGNNCGEYTQLFDKGS